MMTLEELLTGASSVGLRVNNLFQLKSDGREMWQANVRGEKDEDECYEFGRGATPTEAMIAAYKAAGVNVEDDGT